MKDTEWGERGARLFCFCVYALIAYVVLKYLLPSALPLIVAILIGAGVFCISEKFSRLSHLPHAVCAIAVICITVTVFGTASVYLCRYLLAQIKQLLFILSQGGAEAVFARAREIYVFRFVCSFITDGEHSADSLVTSALSGALSLVGDFIGGLLGRVIRATPTALLTGVVAVIACFYVAIDMRGIRKSLGGLLPLRTRLAVSKVSAGVLPVLKSFAGAYLKIYALTFFEVFLGLCLLCPRFALLGALAVATVDILPVLGAGIVLIPWGIAELLMENYFVGVGLLLLYVVISIVRQIVEPRLLGSAVGLSPFVALIVMFVGYKFLGIGGMLILPIALSVWTRIHAENKN